MKLSFKTLLCIFYSKLDYIKCFTHGRIKEKYCEMIENPENNIMKTPNKDRTYFTSVEMDIFGYSKQTDSGILKTLCFIVFLVLLFIDER